MHSLTTTENTFGTCSSFRHFYETCGWEIDSISLNPCVWKQHMVDEPSDLASPVPADWAETHVSCDFPCWGHGHYMSHGQWWCRFSVTLKMMSNSVNILNSVKLKVLREISTVDGILRKAWVLKQFIYKFEQHSNVKWEPYYRNWTSFLPSLMCWQEHFVSSHQLSMTS